MPNQPAGVFWAVVNRLLIIAQVIILIFSEIGWPAAFFDRFFPVLGKDFGLGALGVIQCLYVLILSHQYCATNWFAHFRVVLEPPYYLITLTTFHWYRASSCSPSVVSILPPQGHLLRALIRVSSQRPQYLLWPHIPCLGQIQTLYFVLA